MEIVRVTAGTETEKGVGLSEMCIWARGQFCSPKQHRYCTMRMILHHNTHVATLQRSWYGLVHQSYHVCRFIKPPHSAASEECGARKVRNSDSGPEFPDA